MKRKLNLLCYSFGPEAPTRLQNRQKCQPRADTARRTATCTACASGGGCCLYLRPSDIRVKPADVFR
ncbi:hypothetical protein NDA07_06905 [Microcoleus vaginatus DQ-U2]|uniref:hypothetical protein n=1 Tax=Microcoleus TaxID=44471 RepID=UPI001689DA15|nr:hypothetical protein [Microcoleus sp. FACHB-DQ6]